MVFTVMNTMVKVVSSAQTNRLTLPLRPWPAYSKRKTAFSNAPRLEQKPNT